MNISLGLSIVDSFQSATMPVLHLGCWDPPKGTAQDSGGGWSSCLALTAGLLTLQSDACLLHWSWACPRGQSHQMVTQSSCRFDPQRPFGGGWQPELPLRGRTNSSETLSYSPWPVSVWDATVPGKGQALGSDRPELTPSGPLAVRL